MSALKAYDVVVNGTTTRMKLTEAEAKAMGVAKNKARSSSETPNKAVTPDPEGTVDLGEGRPLEPASKSYQVEVNGVTTTMKLSDEDAERLGVAKPKPAPKQAAEKASTPAKKPARKRPANRSRARK